MLTLMMATQVLTYQGEEMEEDEETMADYDVQVEMNKKFKKPSQDGSTILLQPKLASGFISHPNRYANSFFP